MTRFSARGSLSTSVEQRKDFGGATMKNGPYSLVVAPPKYPGKRYRDRYAYEHTAKWWKKYGSTPPRGFEIHHKNGDHRDNRISNLRLLTMKAHRQLHAELQKKKCRVKIECGQCQRKFVIKGNVYRWRMKQNQSRKIFCSVSCGAIRHRSVGE